VFDDILWNVAYGVTPWRLCAGLIKIRIVIKPGNTILWQGLSFRSSEGTTLYISEKSQQPTFEQHLFNPLFFHLFADFNFFRQTQKYFTLGRRHFSKCGN
jgi:hypothetical protein